MSELVYNWKRFWIPRDGTFRLDGGYLSDPEVKYGNILNPDVVSLDSTAEMGCLVLLGEPGIGKSNEIKSKWAVTESEVRARGEVALRFDLRDYSSDGELRHDIFESSTFQDWLQGTHNLHLFLDSLDEGLLAVGPLATFLLKELKKYPVDRLYFRIACRTAEWPSILESGLEEIWGKDRVKIYELLPLRRNDVIHAAEVNELNANHFLQEVSHKEAEPLASKPITLNLLLKLYKKNARLPHAQTELYLEGCRELCDEKNESRIASKRTGKLTANQRLILAARIAAITIFGNRSGIWTGRNKEDAENSDVILQDLCGGNENVDGEMIATNEFNIREVLDTGLFVSRGVERMGWAHQTYAEFLAALYLRHHRTRLTQKLDLILHHGDSERKLVPQLYETAAWLAGMDQDVFKETMNTDPEVLLRSDVANTEAKDKEKLVETLLTLYEKEKLPGNRFLFNYYRKLSHTNLAEQLSPYITDNSKRPRVRQIAIDIAEACELKELQHVLAETALYSTVPIEVRIDAAHAVVRIGDDEAKKKLKPLIADNPDDKEKSLKGYALQAVWPIALSAEELFDILSYARNEFHGSYAGFIYEDLSKHLRLDDLPIALNWIEKQPSRNSSSQAFNKLMDAIMLKAWEHLDKPTILQAFAKAALSRLRHYDPIVRDGRSSFDELLNRAATPPFSSLVDDDDKKRHQVLNEMIAVIDNPEKQCIELTYKNPFLLSKDLRWLIEQFEASESQQRQLILARLINNVFYSQDPAQLSLMYEAIQRNSLLANIFEHLFKAVDLDSTEAEEMKSHYLEMQKWQKQELPVLDPSPAQRIVDLLDEFESGDYSAWWQVNYFMLFEPDGSGSYSEYQSDLKALPGWKVANAVIRLRIIEAAKRYLLNEKPDSYECIVTDTIYRPVFAGYRALHLLLSETPEFISTLTVDVWKIWAPIVFAFSTMGEKENHEVQIELIGKAYSQAPEEIIQTLMLLIDKENEQFGTFHSIEKIEHCWDARIVNALLNKLKCNQFKTGTISSLLSKLLAHNVDEAGKYAISLITLPRPLTEEQFSMAVASAQQLILHTEDAGWPIIWPVIQHENSFGRKLVESISYSEFGIKELARALTEEQLADLYIWLVHNYPYAEDPEHPPLIAYSVTPRDRVASWGESILAQLKERGSLKACSEIQRIVNELPEIDWLKWTLLSAQEITRRNTWNPPEPAEILKLVRDSESGLVQSGKQLLDLVIESLKRLEGKLQDNTPAAIDLWDEVEKGVYKPKDENRLSDYIKRHLEEDLVKRGVIINREVEIRRGERTDLHIDAVRKQDGEVYDTITIIIEVKGCWNRGVKTAIETQLVNRYLTKSRCNHGLYLVGWYNCDQWTRKDYRKRQAPKLTTSDAQKLFEAAAAKLSQGGKLIKALVLNTALRNEDVIETKV